MSLVIFQLIKWKSANKLFLKGGLIENVIILYIVCIKENTMYETKYYLVFHFQLFIFLRKSSREIIFPVDCILILKQFEMLYPSSDVWRQIQNISWFWVIVLF